MLVIKKVYAYITNHDRLLVFRHVDNPEAGIQVPGGSVEEGEAVMTAVVREVREETGLKEITLVEKLGVSEYDLARIGVDGIHERHYFHFHVDDYPGERWIAFEETPSDGSPGPIKFEFFWADLQSVPPLLADMDEMISKIRH